MSRKALLQALAAAMPAASQKLEAARQQGVRGDFSQVDKAQKGKSFPNFVAQKGPSNFLPKLVAAIDVPTTKSAKEFAQSFLQHAAEDGAWLDYLQDVDGAEKVGLPDKKSAKEFQESLQEFAQSLLQHTAEDGVGFDDLQGDSQAAEGGKIDRKKVASGAAYIYQILAASQVFFGASVASATLSEKGFAGLGKIKENPRILVDGLSMMFLYNIFATEAALVVGSKIRGEGENESFARIFFSILASSATETAIGNPLDFYSLERVFSLAKIERSLKTNPSLFEALRADKDLFQSLVPQALQQASNEELSKNCAKLNFSEKNVAALKLLKPELNISAKEWVKMNAAGSTFAALRNINFYLLTYLINQSNVAAKDGEEKELTAAEITAIGTLGSAITSPLNMAAYSAAFRSIEGADMFEAMKQGLKHAFADTAKNPRIFACLVALRAAATLICSEIFSDKTKENIGGIVDALMDAINSIVKSEEKSKKLDEEVGEKKGGLGDLKSTARKNEVADKNASPASSSQPSQVSKVSGAEGEKKGPDCGERTC